MLYIHTSHQLEILKNEFAGLLKQPLVDTFAAEKVIVQNAGMARWLSMQMANAVGISANTEFLFPAEFMWQLLRLVSADIPEQSQCAPEVLRFHIFTELISHTKDYPELAHYITKQHESHASINTGNVWELASQLAQLFDHYLFYRSDWIKQWEDSDWNSSQHHWQSRLWLKCVKDKKLLHWVALQEQFRQNINLLDEHLLAERISFFSMSALSPGYLDLLAVVAEKTDIHIFIINPCKDEYWGDIQAPKTLSKLPVEEQQYSEIGNPLLASLGKQGRDFIFKLLEISQADVITTNDPHFDDSDTTVLQQIQRDIYHLHNVTFNKNLESKIKKDNSIQFNSCHTAMREIEVLHDQILALLDHDQTLAPSDIVVMMPDIDKYAPYIEALFSNNIVENQKLPFSIADRDPQTIFSTIQAIIKLFALPETMYEVEAVFELLEYNDIRKQFNLDENELNYCRELARSANIRWGISNQTRQKQDLPNTEEHTWTYVLERILLGYSLADSANNTELFSSERNLKLLPYSEIEGSNAQIYANFKKFTDSIFAINDWQLETHSLEDWINKTRILIQQLTPENTDQQQLFNTLDDLLKTSEIAEFNANISFNVYQTILQQSLSAITANEKYLGYGITFCAMVPMRSVPFKVVALMGMNDGDFPRQDSRLSFDLMLDKTHRGDRSRRDEDRYLFLESILAARAKLMISFIGQSIKDNTDLAPSIVISELLDTLEVMTGTKANKWINKHPLHAFSQRYFSNSETDKHLFSYAQEYAQIETHGVATKCFISEPLAELDKEFKRLSLDTLVHFFNNPARFFLKQSLGIQSYEEQIELKTREPFELESFKEREIRNLILAQEITNTEKQQIARAKGLLPYGEIGENIYIGQQQLMENYLEHLPDIDFQSDLQLELNIGEFNLSAKLDQLCNFGRCITQVNQPYANDYIELWLTHLVLNLAFQEDPLKTTSQFYSPEISFQLKAVDKPADKLQHLLDYYWQGLHFPLEFFPKSAFAQYEKGKKKSFQKCSDKWNGNFYAGEKQRFENYLLHREVTLENEEQSSKFVLISDAIFADMYQVYEEIS